MSLIKTYLHNLQSQTQMNYTLKQLQDRVNSMIKEQGEDAECAAWIYTKNDVCIVTDDGDELYPCENNPELTERIFYQVGDCDHIYTCIQDAVDDATEEQYMLLQQELV